MESIDFNFNIGKLEKNDLIHTLGDADIDNFATQISLFLLQKIAIYSPFSAQILLVFHKKLTNL